MALMGTGVASGENRAVEAARRAISNRLLEEESIQGAKGVLINITGGNDLLLHEVSEASGVIYEAADSEANIIFGAVRDERIKDEVKITVIATGFDRHKSAELPLRQVPRAESERTELENPNVSPEGDYTLIWIDPVNLPLRFSNAPPSMCWIQGAAGMIRDGGSL